MSSYNNDNKDYKYEYNRLPLKGSESKYIYIPLSVIVDDELDTKGVGILSYLKIHSGLNDVVGFTVNDMVEWCGLKPNKREGKSNDNFLEIMDVLSDRGYFTYLTEHSRSSYMKCKMDSDYYYNECSNGYAVVYLDELEKILNYKDSKGSSLLNTYILLVFAYFRYKIMRRPNELKPEERSEEGIEKRRARIPDAYSSTISDMADELGIHKQTFSKIVDILEEELKLIVTDRAYRVKISDSKYKTLPTIFANAYKREDKYLLAVGEDYSRTEIELKAENIKQYYQNYKINKDKRR
jgi:hypothetical protein